MGALIGALSALAGTVGIGYMIKLYVWQKFLTWRARQQDERKRMRRGRRSHIDREMRRQYPPYRGPEQ